LPAERRGRRGMRGSDALTQRIRKRLTPNKPGDHRGVAWDEHLQLAAHEPALVSTDMISRSGKSSLRCLITRGIGTATLVNKHDDALVSLIVPCASATTTAAAGCCCATTCQCAAKLTATAPSARTPLARADADTARMPTRTIAPYAAPLGKTSPKTPNDRQRRAHRAQMVSRAGLAPGTPDSQHHDPGPTA
jgi:hypothetical protein